MTRAVPIAAMIKLLRWGLQSFRQKPHWIICAAVIVAGELFGLSVSALPPYVAHMYALLMQAGVMVLIVATCYDAMTLCLRGDADYTGQLAYSLIKRIVLLCVALQAISIPFVALLIETIISEAVNFPGNALAAGGAGVVFAFIFNRTRPVHEGGAFAPAVAYAGFVRRMTDDERHKVAVHEAGHLLLFGLLSEIPEGLEVRVAEETGKESVRGQVKMSLGFDVLTTETRLRWLMWMLMAGMEAQFVVFGERSDGADTDMQEWRHAALRYLASGFGEDVLCSAPAAETDDARNLLALRVLKRECEREVRALLAQNRAVLDELTACALKGASREALIPILARVEGVRVKVGALAISQ